MTEYRADAFFSRGKTHLVCEDYARAGVQQNGLPYAVLSDGCSSSPETDTGARLLAHAASFQMHWIASGESSFRERERLIIDTAANAMNELDVDMRALDATLMAAWPAEQDGQQGVKVAVRGDGVIVARARGDADRGYSMVIVHHPRNAPRYLSYDLVPKRRQGYLDEFGDKTLCSLYTSGLGWISEEGYDFQGHHDEWFYDRDTFDLVMVLSDGVQTFQRVVHSRAGTSKYLRDVPVEEVVPHLLQIKGTKGKFLQRRCHKFLDVYCDVEEWQHADDFSAAAIWMGDPNA